MFKKAGSILILFSLFIGKSWAIGNGTPESIGEPIARSMVALQMMNNTICSSTVLSRTVLLTAAHCTYGYEDKKLRKLTVDEIYARQLLNGKAIRIKTIIRNPKYMSDDPENTSNDVALLELEAPLSSYYQPIKLADSLPEDRLKIAGIGPDSEEGVSLLLRSGDVDFDKEDNYIYNYATSDVLEALGGQGVKMTPVNGLASSYFKITKTNEAGNICKGDSGGALFSLQGKQFIQYGVTSSQNTQRRRKCAETAGDFENFTSLLGENGLFIRNTFEEITGHALDEVKVVPSENQNFYEYYIKNLVTISHKNRWVDLESFSLLSKGDGSKAWIINNKTIKNCTISSSDIMGVMNFKENGQFEVAILSRMSESSLPTEFPTVVKQSKDSLSLFISTPDGVIGGTVDSNLAGCKK